MYQSEKRSMALHPALPGEHQFDNAGAAVACIDQLPQFTIGEAQIAQGLTNAVWPARLQKLTQGRYAVLMPDGMELWLDGGHNPQGAEVLAKWFEQQHKEIHLVCGMVKDKDAAGFLRILTPYVTSLQAVAIPGEQLSKPAELVAQAAKKVGMAAEVSPSLQNALQTIVQRAKTPSIICICGSLYLAGKVLATN